MARWQQHLGNLVLATSVGAFVQAASANDIADGKVTFTRDVAPILYENCLHCHRVGEVAPMSLRTFDEARPWAKAIKQKVQAREMPPWFADPAHGSFANDPRLSDDQIATIVNWVDQGAVQGDPNEMPAQPNFTEGWQLGEPDYVIDLPEAHVPAEGDDYFPDLGATVDLPEDRWVRAVEIRPSNRLVAHHVVIFSAGGMGGGGAGHGGGATHGGGMRTGGRGMGGNFGILAVWAVGTAPTVFPEGSGRWVRKGERLMTNMHYHPNGTPQTDQTRIGLYFGKGEMQNEVLAALNGTFNIQIPAQATNHELTASWMIDQDVNITSFFPHMHLRGKDMIFTANYPDGRKETLLNIPKWDFNWQLFYYPEKFVFLPKGTSIDVVAHYDNSPANPNNPDPTRNVGFGMQSTDEMMFGVFEFIPATLPVSEAPAAGTD